MIHELLTFSYWKLLLIEISILKIAHPRYQNRGLPVMKNQFLCYFLQFFFYFRKKVQELHGLLILIFDLISLPSLFDQFIETNENTPIECFDQHGDQYKNKRWHPDSNLAQKLIRIVDQISLDHNNYMGVSFLPCLFCSIFLDTLNFSYRGRTCKLEASWRLPVHTKRLESLNKNLNAIRNQLENNVPIQTYSRLPETIQPLSQYNGLYSDDICHMVDFFQQNQNSNKILNSFNNGQFNQLIIDLMRLRDSALEAVNTRVENERLELSPSHMGPTHFNVF